MERSAQLLLQSFGVFKDLFGRSFRRLNFYPAKLFFQLSQFFVLPLQFAVAKESLINLPRLLLRSFEVKAPHQVVLGKSF